MGDRLFDDLARALAEPMPRSRLLRLAGAAALGAMVPAGLRPVVGVAGIRENCAAKPDRPKECACDHPSGTGQFQTCCWHEAACWCKPIGAQCCAAGTGWSGVSKMDPGTCVPICVPKGGPNARKVQKYDPKTQCCGVQGVMGKTENFAARLCKDDEGNSTLKPRPGYRPTSNGCGSEDFDVGDGFTFEETIRGKTRTGSVSFTKACNAHDRCYGTCRADKKECDDAFRKAMKRRCKATFSGKDEFSQSFRDQCLEQAGLYRFGVSFADSDYWAAQTEACHCC